MASSKEVERVKLTHKPLYLLLPTIVCSLFSQLPLHLL